MIILSCFPVCLWNELIKNHADEAASIFLHTSLTLEHCITENLIKMYLVDIFRFVLHTTVVRIEAFVFWKLIILHKFYVWYSYADICNFYSRCLGFRLLLSNGALGCQCNAWFELVHCTEFLITFQTADLITLNSCINLEPKEIWSSEISDNFKKDCVRFFVFSCYWFCMFFRWGG